jgi:hypothetical protein
MQPIIEKMPEAWRRTNANKILAQLQGELASLTLKGSQMYNAD